jgi:hypothetical protein
MFDLWKDNPELAQRYNKILEQTRRLQAEFGIVPRTLEERICDFHIKKQQEQQRKVELAKLTAIKRPLPISKMRV